MRDRLWSSFLCIVEEGLQVTGTRLTASKQVQPVGFARYAAIWRQSQKEGTT
jgi:hypothetical protein